MKQIQLQITIPRISSRRDGSLGLTVETPELTKEEKLEVMELQNEVLQAVFIPIDEPNAPVFKVNADLESKTPSQRLRNVLYVLWEQSKVNEEFDSYYRRMMESLIEGVKRKLE